LIGYDALHVYGSPSYYAIKMLSQNHGDSILGTSVENGPLHYCATRDTKTGAIYVTVVNTQSTPKPVVITLKGADPLASEATAMTLSSPSPDDTNSIDDPDHVVPVTTIVRNVKPTFTHAFAPYSVTVLQLKGNGSQN
jgi:alpha-N-arabinofuranosidase